MFSGKKSDKVSKPAGGKSKVPPYFLCPITMDIMEDPTITSCGHMFERTAIMKWLKEEANNGCCPLCQQRVSESSLSPCYPLKAAIAEFRGAVPKQGGVDDGNMLSTINRKIGNMSLFGNKGAGNGKEPAFMDQPKTAVKKRPKAENNANIGIKKNMNHRSGASSPSSLSKGSGKKAGASRPWARLLPILDNNFEQLDIINEEFTFGRSHNCDRIVDASEISSTHCVIYRVLRENGSDYDHFIEDKSTNGTFVNGSRVGKGLIASIQTGDELSLGERFCSKLIPKVSSFIDWVFSQVDMPPERKVEAERAKQFTNFFQLLAADNARLKAAGVKSDFVRSKLLTALQNWKDKYRFPAYKIEIAGMPSKTGTIRPKVTPSMAMSGGGSSGEEEMSEVNFDPADYIERDSAGVVVMNLRRTKGMRNSLVILVSSSDRSPTKPGAVYQPFQRQVAIGEGESEAVVEFFWKTDKLHAANAVIKFEMHIVTGRGVIGRNSFATLTIEMPSTKFQKKDKPSPPPGAAGGSSDEEADGESDIDQDKMDAVRKTIDDELLAIMMDSFPTIDPKEITEVIKKERKMIFPIEDKHLLQDMVAIKLTNMLRGGDELDMTSSNIKMVKLSTSDEMGEGNKGDNQEFGAAISPQSPNKQPASASPTPSAPPASTYKNPPLPALDGPVNQGGFGGLQPGSANDGSKFRQTILRSELESFLLMASISLIRKFFSIQGIDCNYAHLASPVVSTSASITDAFMKTIREIPPIESSPSNPQDDVFDFDKLVELFKKYVYQKGSDLRSSAVPIEPRLLKEAYRYDIACHKSAHHFKMENNHALIEDLNTFAKFSRDVPQTSFYGVFDGHGGYLVSEYLSLHLALNVARHPLFQKNIAEAFKQGYAKTDELVLKKVQRDKLKGGSTAVTAVIRENTIHVAWAGDARCLLFRRMGENLVAFPLINPHNPQGSEKNRIVKAGGFVEFIAGKWRVNGRLAVTRSFGDENLKPVVTSEPEYSKYPMQGDEEFLLLSCDGLYDVMDYSDVAEHLDESMKKGLKLGQLAASLVKEGVDRKSTDDITVMLINLSRNPRI